MGLAVSVAGEEARPSPIPNDRRGRRPRQSGAGLLRPVRPATCATVSLDTGMMLAEKTVSDSESDARSHDVRSPVMSASSPVSKDADSGYLSSGSLWLAVSSRLVGAVVVSSCRFVALLLWRSVESWGTFRCSSGSSPGSFPSLRRGLRTNESGGDLPRRCLLVAQ